MKFHTTDIEGVVVIDPEPITDERGYFARLWSSDEFHELGLGVDWVQANTGFSHREGTIRGMHLQRDPHAEAKLVWCPRGRVFDVAVDTRESSPTRWSWVSAELSELNQRLLFLPPGFAHGYQTLAPDTQIMYWTSHRYVPESAAGLRWNDPTLAVGWPAPASIVSEQDGRWPLIEAEEMNK